MVKYYLLLIGAWLAPRVPYQLAARVVGVFAWVAWALGGESRQRARENLAHVPGLANDPKRLAAATRGVYLQTALNYLDFLRGPYLTDSQLRDRWVIAGQEVLDEAVAEGKGVVVLTAHFGNWEYGVSRLGAIGYQIVTPMEHLQPEALYQLFCRVREHHNLHLLPADARETARRLLESLREGALVTILADRHVIGNSIEVPFFGEPARLPTAPMALALRSGAAAFAIFCWREPDGYSHGEIIDLRIHEKLAASGGTRNASGNGTASAEVMGEGAQPATATASAPARTRTRAARGDKEEIGRAMEIFVQAMEEVIEAHPEQWGSALSPVWDGHETLDA